MPIPPNGSPTARARKVPVRRLSPVNRPATEAVGRASPPF